MAAAASKMVAAALDPPLSSQILWRGANFTSVLLYDLQS